MVINKKLQTLGLAIGLPFLISLAFYFIHDTPELSHIELKTLDARFKYSTHSVKANPEVVVVLIDESSLQAMEPLVGRWPWPRSLHGELIDFLTQAEARAVLFDILFTEPQVPRDANGALGASDEAMAMASGASGISHHAFQIFRDIEDEYNKELTNRPLPKNFVERFSLPNIKVKTKLTNTNQFYLPIHELYENSFSMGVVEFQSDSDGVYRSTHLLRPYQGSLYPVLAMSHALRRRPYKEIILGSKELKIDDKKIPLLLDGRYLINMKKEFTNYSIGGIFATIQKINQGETESLVVNPADFKDKIVFVGASAVGVDDLKLTSTGTSVPGVYLHASLMSNYLDNDFITQFPVPLTFIIFAALNILMGVLVMTGNNLTWPLILFVVTIVGHLFSAFYVFDMHRVWLLVFVPLNSMLASFLTLFVVKSFTEGKEKRFLKSAFGNYISPELIDMMYQSGEAPKLGGDVGVRTAYFTDIQGFSTFSEKLSATKLVELLNEYLSAMTDILIEEQGTLDKYEGDAIIAFYGAPVPLEDHAQRGVRTALRMQDKLKDLRQKWSSEGDKWPKIVHDMRMRIGINTGEIVTGNMGSKLRMNYTMMGDAVNLAARLEESAKQYGVFTQVSHFTRLAAGDTFLWRELDTIRVVGKTEPITTFEPLWEGSNAPRLLEKLAESFQSGLTSYKAQRWDEAIAHFEISAALELERYPELGHKTNPSKIYLERCQEFKLNPPPADWDGVFNLSHK